MIKPFKIRQSKIDLNSTAGNHLCGTVLGNLPNLHLPENFQPRRSDAIADRNILETQIGLCCNARTNFNDINLYRNDALFMNAYGLKIIASEAAFRTRFDDLPPERTHAALRKLNLELLRQRTFGRVDADGLKLIPTDMDVSPFDNSGSARQGVSFTYKKHVGFVDHLRPGKEEEERPCVPVAFKVVERVIDHDGQELLMPEIEVETYWTNLYCRAETVVALYHDHGTSEQFHSELKSDLNVERLPSGKLCANRIILLCAMVSFNLLRTLGQEALRHKHLAPKKIKVQRWRIKTVLQNLIYCACRIVRHAGSFGTPEKPSSTSDATTPGSRSSSESPKRSHNKTTILSGKTAARRKRSAQPQRNIGKNG